MSNRLGDIYLFRSAETVPMAAGQPGSVHRPLTPKGITEAGNIRTLLPQILGDTRQILTAPSFRTRTTSRLAAAIERPFIIVRPEEALTATSSTELWNFLRGTSEDEVGRPVICVTHQDVIEAALRGSHREPYSEKNELGIPTGSMTKFTLIGSMPVLEFVGLNPAEFVDMSHLVPVLH